MRSFRSKLSCNMRLISTVPAPQSAKSGIEAESKTADISAVIVVVVKRGPAAVDSQQIQIKRPHPCANRLQESLMKSLTDACVIVVPSVDLPCQLRSAMASHCSNTSHRGSLSPASSPPGRYRMYSTCPRWLSFFSLRRQLLRQLPERDAQYSCQERTNSTIGYSRRDGT